MAKVTNRVGHIQVGRESEGGEGDVGKGKGGWRRSAAEAVGDVGLEERDGGYAVDRHGEHAESPIAGGSSDGSAEGGRRADGGGASDYDDSGGVRAIYAASLQAATSADAERNRGSACERPRQCG
jgi:hypothetical protein